jgi:murein DD-endopeptidase MepM/ murein hydrolase activator NlpD
MRSATLASILVCLPAMAWGAPKIVDGSPSADELEHEIRTLGEERESLAKSKVALEGRIKIRARALYRLARRPVTLDDEGFAALLGHHARVRRMERIVRADVEALRFTAERAQGIEAALAKKKKALDEERVRLTAIAKRRKQLEDRARVFDGDLPTLGVVPVVPLGIPGGSVVVHDADAALSLGFSSLQGKLGAPVRGTFRVRDAVRDGGPGLELLVSQGAPVYSVADGRVAYSDRDPDHGRLVIVDHGQNFFTVYGGLSSVRARIGAFVAKGEAIGAADASGVFFEVRQGARSLDPRHWTGL